MVPPPSLRRVGEDFLTVAQNAVSSVDLVPLVRFSQGLLEKSLLGWDGSQPSTDPKASLEEVACRRFVPGGSDERIINPVREDLDTVGSKR